MLRNEIQEKTGLTRKAIEYYEDKGLINPQRLENGYRNYSEKDLDLLNKISMYRKLGLSIGEIEKCLGSDDKYLSTILRRKEYELDIDNRRKNVLNLIVNGEKDEIIKEKIAQIEAHESIYEKLERIFPGYFGQMIFVSYRPFLNESLDDKQKNSFDEYVKFLDQLPKFELSKDEKDYIEKISSDLSMETLSDVAQSKNKAIENPEVWLQENKEFIEQYDLYKSSEYYQNSKLKEIQDKLQKFMVDNNYYEVAIPLIRKFSKSYDEYYEKLIKANDVYLKYKS
ncbi:MerR family transcriptional regulator [Anaerococcus sp. ENR1011]|uniref:MerR family transcriptional regulator n=1 Tax=Anaerococcus groningensis TaxID=3115616 RepID=A0ABW9N193_9FIRM